MPTDIKKRSASHIYYGVDQATGEPRHIAQVSSGLQCGCKCLSCGKPLEARKGTLRQHHFAYVSNYVGGTAQSQWLWAVLHFPSKEKCFFSFHFGIDAMRAIRIPAAAMARMGNFAAMG